jgi:hypothetical protein
MSSLGLYPSSLGGTGGGGRLAPDPPLIALENEGRLAGGEAGNEGEAGDREGNKSSSGDAATVLRFDTDRLVRRRICELALLEAKLVMLLGVGGTDSSSWNSIVG